MAELIPVLTQEDLSRIIADLAEKISNDYKGRDLVLIGMLKGAFIFMADLARMLTIPVHISFLKASSYGQGTVSSKDPLLTGDLAAEVRGRDVLIVEDIVDTGITLVKVLEHMQSLSPCSVEICALIDKRERREREVAVRYAGRVLHSGFLVGYGLDYAEDYRHLPEIFTLNL